MIARYFPAYILLFVFGISYKAWTETISSIVVFMNSSLNQILFCWRIRDLPVTMLKMTEGMLCTPQIKIKRGNFCKAEHLQQLSDTLH